MTLSLVWIVGLAIGLLFGWSWGYTHGSKAGRALGMEEGKSAMFFALKRVRPPRQTETN